MKSTVYIGDVSPLLESDLFERLLNRVPAYRREKIARIKHSIGRAQSLAVALLLQKGCWDFGIPGADASIVLGENGKPDFAIGGKFSGIHFNLSHSHYRAMCVISNYEVGCDVEQIKKSRSRLAEHFFSVDENQWIQSASTVLDENGDEEKNVKRRDVAFCRLWTLKESYMKVTGCGLSLSPGSFFFELKNDGTILLHHEGVHPEYLFREIDLNDGYRYAYCLKNAQTDESVSVVQVNWNYV